MCELAAALKLLAQLRVLLLDVLEQVIEHGQLLAQEVLLLAEPELRLRPDVLVVVVDLLEREREDPDGLELELLPECELVALEHGLERRPVRCHILEHRGEALDERGERLCLAEVLILLEPVEGFGCERAAGEEVDVVLSRQLDIDKIPSSRHSLTVSFILASIYILSQFTTNATERHIKKKKGNRTLKKIPSPAILISHFCSRFD